MRKVYAVFDTPLRPTLGQTFQRRRTTGIFAMRLSPILAASTLVLALASPLAAAEPQQRDASEVARCIVEHAPRGARYFQTSDGSIRVVANGLHGGTARRTIAPAAPALHVVLEGGSAGIAKSVAGLCY